MKPRPIRMPDSLWNELGEEAEEHDLGTAEYVRRILRNRQEITLEVTQEDTQELSEQVAELEERVAALETGRGEGGSGGPEGRGRADTDPSARTSADAETPEPIEHAVSSWSPGRGTEDRELRRDALRLALKWLAEEGHATRTGFVDEFYPDTALESHDSADGWWRGMMLKGLKHAAEVGVVEKDGHSWVWVGSED